jgi:hypothetical protein
MTTHPAAPEEELPDARQASGLAELIDNLARAETAGLLKPGDPLQIALAFWSTVHGITSLAITNPSLPRELTHRILDVTAEAVINHYAE